MKKIIFTSADGGVAVVHPAEGQRLAFAIQDAASGDIIELRDKAEPVDTFRRKWPVPGIKAVWAETEEEFLARVASRSVPQSATNVQFVDASLIPADRTFRNAWKQNGAGIVHDMPKCRELHKLRLRELRAPKLAALDIEYQRADERGDTSAKRSIAAQKQTLRDVTADPAIEQAATADELKAVIPEALR